MGDVTIANDLIDGVREVLAEVGDTTTFQIKNVNDIDINNPGANPGDSPSTVEFEAFLFEFVQEYMPEANISDGGTMAIIDIKDLTTEQISDIEVGNRLINQSVTYTIVNTNKIQVAGKPVTFILQLDNT